MMLIRDQLKGKYSEGDALAIYQAVKATEDFVAFARTYMYDEEDSVTRNALWGLTKATDEELSQLQSLLYEFMDISMKHNSSSLRRIALNIIERLEIATNDLRTDFYDYCLEHMVDVNEYPGIQSLCMKLGFRMASFYPELMQEFMRMVEGMEIGYYKPAVMSVRKRILSGKLK